MPQLIPDLWFFIFILIWTMIILIMPRKINNHKFLNKPTNKMTYVKQLTWTWPWT